MSFFCVPYDVAAAIEQGTLPRFRIDHFSFPDEWAKERVKDRVCFMKTLPGGDFSLKLHKIRSTEELWDKIDRERKSCKHQRQEDPHPIVESLIDTKRMEIQCALSKIQRNSAGCDFDLTMHDIPMADDEHLMK